MTAAEDILVFDTGPLSHFAKGGWLGALKAVVGTRRAIMPLQVVDELRQGVHANPFLQSVLDADWIEHRELDGENDLRQFAKFSERLVAGGRNVGEAAVLALASTMDALAVVDDAAARKAADRHGVRLKPTLALLCDAIHADLLTIELVSALADDLIATKYRLPFRPGGFEAWAREEGIFS